MYLGGKMAYTFFFFFSSNCQGENIYLMDLDLISHRSFQMFPKYVSVLRTVGSVSFKNPSWRATDLPVNLPSHETF